MEYSENQPTNLLRIIILHLRYHGISLLNCQLICTYNFHGISSTTGKPTNQPSIPSSNHHLTSSPPRLPTSCLFSRAPWIPQSVRLLITPPAKQKGKREKGKRKIAKAVGDPQFHHTITLSPGKNSPTSAVFLTMP